MHLHCLRQSREGSKAPRERVLRELAALDAYIFHSFNTGIATRAPSPSSGSSSSFGGGGSSFSGGGGGDGGGDSAW